MSLAQLIYISRRNDELTLPVLMDIVEKSKIANAARGITGLLLCCGDDLMQLLEGELNAIQSLYEVIREDSRHSKVKCLICKNVRKRIFPEWGMGLADLDHKSELNRDRLVQLIADVRASHDTSEFGVEARILLHDFKLQLGRAA